MNDGVCQGLWIFTKDWDPTLAKIGPSAWVAISMNDPGRARRTHSVWGSGLIWCPGIRGALSQEDLQLDRTSSAEAQT